MSALPAVEAGAPVAPPPPRPAGVVDLGRYRGRVGRGPAAVPPPRPTVAGAGPGRSELSPVVAAPVLVPTATAPTLPDLGAVGGDVVIRRVRLGSVLPMACGLSLCTVLVVVGAGVLIWVTISTLGVVEDLESLAEDLGWTNVAFDGPAMFRSACVGGGVLVVTASFLSVVFAEVFNLLSMITGGLRAEVGPAPLSRRDRRRIRKAVKAKTKVEARPAEPLTAGADSAQG